jgi:diguanylate cyclase (GGDEF)-like protein
MLVEYLEGANEITEEGGQIYRLVDFPATKQVLETQEPIQIRVSNERDDPAERALLAARRQGALLMLPLICGGETIGMMEIVDKTDRAFDPADVDFCQALCNVVAPAVQNAMLYTQMKELAARDKLTGLYNRRLFEEQFDAAVARSQRNGEQLSLLVVDLDGLKRINDLGGHPAGDEALRALADSLLESSRAGDITCRIGGDEFAVILPGANPDDAIKVAERAQEALIERGPYSFSGGVARAATNLGSSYDLYRSADIAAYRAKAAGGARTLLGVEARAAS